MFGLSQHEATAIYGMTSRSRCISLLAAVDDSQSADRFLVGTCGLHEENEVHLVEVSYNDTPEISGAAIWPHAGEVTSLSPSTTDPNLFFTSFNLPGTAEPGATLWRIPDDLSDSLEPQGDVAKHDGPVVTVVWNPHKEDQIAVVDRCNLRMCQIDTEITETHAINKPEMRFSAAKWSPTSPMIVAAASGSTVRGFDIRQKQEDNGFVIERAHVGCVRDFDFNPCFGSCIATGGDDGALRFWDTRKLSAPIKSFYGHSHWVWCVKYHPVHDELVATSGSDHRVVLWNAASVSSSNQKNTPGEDASISRLPSDGVVKEYEEHEESVYGLAWGTLHACNWRFVSLCYGGRVVVNTVPHEYSDLHKY
eukprot:m51a1_g6442 hypothetical protein (364) ;mRNA; r:384999-386517